MKPWLDYFEHNRKHRREIPWLRGLRIESHLLPPLIRSMQRFQLGESGEGEHLRKQAGLTGDAVYAAAIELFVKEEQEHARLMGRILCELGAPLLTHHWSDAAFMLLRRCFGLQHELLVLLMPEMIARRYFRAVRDGTQDVVLRTVCEQILHDEEGHVAFHVDYLQKALSRLSLSGRVCLRAVWRLGFRLSCVAMIADHWRLLTAAKVSPTAFWWDCGLIFDEVAASIFTCAPTPVMERMALGFQLK